MRTALAFAVDMGFVMLWKGLRPPRCVVSSVVREVCVNYGDDVVLRGRFQGRHGVANWGVVHVHATGLAREWGQ